MTHTGGMRTRLVRHRLRLETLEQRLPPGDAMLSMLMGWSALTPSIAELESLENPVCHNAADMGMGGAAEVRPVGESMPAVTTAGQSTQDNEKPDDPALVTSVDFTSRLPAPGRRVSDATGLSATMTPGPISLTAPTTRNNFIPTRGESARLRETKPHSVSLGAPAADATSKINSTNVDEIYGKLPMGFEANLGQSDGQVDFIARGPNYTTFLTPTEAVFDVKASGAAEGGAVLRMQMVGADAAADAAGVNPLTTKLNYFIGNDPSQWHTHVPTYSKVEYDNVYAGIDLVYYAKNQDLEYDFVVEPGADPSQIQLGFAGADTVVINGRGDLLLSAGDVQLLQQRPYIYQDVNGVRQEVAGEFRIQNSEFSDAGTSLVTFDIGQYDATHPLVIDPVVLSYSTYLGGSAPDFATDIALDISNNAYVTGATFSANFPVTSGAYDTAIASGTDAFVAKLSADGSSVVYATFLGGNAIFDGGFGITVDRFGNAYVAGETGAVDFPTTAGAFQTVKNGSSDSFVAKLSPDGSALTYSTFLGGSGFERGWDIAVDAAGRAFVSGYTSAADFPVTAGAFQTVYGRGARDATLAKLTADGSSLVYATYLGGLGSDTSYSLAIDRLGNAYVTGETDSLNFPTTSGAFDVSANGGIDAFVAKLSPSGATLGHSTYFGGAADDRGYGIVANRNGSTYIVGQTNSVNLPTTSGAFQTTNNGGIDVFVTKLSPTGALLGYSTYLGGSGNEEALGFDLDRNAIAIDRSGNAYVIGQTDSTNFPTTAGVFQPANAGAQDAFVTKLNVTGTALVYSTYLGSSANDGGNGIFVSRVGDAYVTGNSTGTDFPTTSGAFQTTFGGSGGGDAFVSKIVRV